MFTRRKIIPCPRIIFCNTFEQMNVPGDILNDVGNFEDQEDYGITASLLKIDPTVIDELQDRNR